MKDTKAILTEAYPLIEAGLKKNNAKYKKYISDFINRNADILYSNIPSKQLYFSLNHIQRLSSIFFTSFISES